MTPTVVVCGLLAAAYVMIRRWERLQQREWARHPESQPVPAPQDAPGPGKVSWWKRILRTR